MVETEAVTARNPAPVRNDRAGVLVGQFWLFRDLSEPAADAERVALAQRRLVAIEAKSEKVDRPRVHEEHLPVRLERQADIIQVAFDRDARLMQRPLVRPKHHQVVDVADVIPHAETLFNVVVQSL